MSLGWWRHASACEEARMQRELQLHLQSAKRQCAMWPLAAFSSARMSLRIARGPARAAKGSVVHVWLLSPCIKNINFSLEMSRISKKIRLRRYETPLAALAGMLYLYKYFRFLLQKWPRKLFRRLRRPKFFWFFESDFFCKKVEIGRCCRKVIHLLWSGPCLAKI